MSLELQQGGWLWLFLPIVLLLIWVRWPWWQWVGWRNDPAFIRRAMAVLLLLFAGAGAQLGWVQAPPVVLFVVDASASVNGARIEADRWVQDALTQAPDQVRTGIISFAGEVRVEHQPGSTPPAWQGPQVRHDGHATDIEAALRAARDWIPAGSRSRVVILSDGRATQGDPVSAAASLRSAQVQVDVVPVGEPDEADRRLLSLSTPETAREGEQVPFYLRVHTPFLESRRIVVERDGEVVADVQLDLHPGEQESVIHLPAGEPGFHRYSARLMEPLDREGSGQSLPQDPILENNHAAAVQQVLGPPELLVLRGENETARTEAERLLTLLQTDVALQATVARPYEVPASAFDFARYDAVWLVDLPASELPENLDQLLRDYVEAGGGLIMSGGANAFGLGGYGGTPIEEALPVNMSVEGEGESPPIALVFVIDRSGSMGTGEDGDKLSLAKAAVERAVTLLRPHDRAGVVAFDDRPHLLVPLASVGEDGAERIRSTLAHLRGGGGTNIYPAIQAAYDALTQTDAEVKHVVLLSDGMSAAGGDYAGLTEAFRAMGATLSTVALGHDADSFLMEALARMGAGRFHQSDLPENLPEIFAQETVAAIRRFSVNERFSPVVAARSSLLQQLEQIPHLDGYVAASTKPRAESVLLSHRGEPVLSAWQFGRGRSVAWTSDLGSRWATAWLNQGDLSRLASNILSWVLPPPDSNRLEVRAEPVHMNGKHGFDITVAAPLDAQPMGGTLHWLGPEGTGQASLESAGPGIYRARVEGEAGAYLFDATIVTGADESGDRLETNMRQRWGAVLPPPLEVSAYGVDRRAVAQLVDAGGGEILIRPDQAYREGLRPGQAQIPLRPWLLTLAVLLLLYDIAARRLGWQIPLALWGRRLLDRYHRWRRPQQFQDQKGQSTLRPHVQWTGSSSPEVERVGKREVAASVSTIDQPADGATSATDSIGSLLARRQQRRPEK